MSSLNACHRTRPLPGIRVIIFDQKEEKLRWKYVKLRFCVGYKRIILLIFANLCAYCIHISD